MKNKINAGFLYVVLAAALWGTAGIFVRTLGDSDISQMQVVFGRALFTALILAVIIFAKDIKLFKIRKKDIPLFILDGIGSIVLFNFSYYTTMSLTSLSVAAVLLYTAPFFVVIIFSLMGRRLTVRKAVACITAFAGCCMVSGVFDSQHRISPKALFFGLLTGFGYALYTIFGDILIKRGYKTLTITFYVFAFAAAGCIPFVSFSGSEFVVTTKTVLWIFFMAVFNTVLPYILYTTGLMKVDSAIAPVIATVEPVVATVVGAWIFKEPLTLWGAAGIFLVLLSVVILNIQFKERIRLKAFAKINLSLFVSGRRPDGYHDIDTIMQTVSLCDIITVEKNKEIRVKCSRKDLSGENNIAAKAAGMFFSETGVKGGAYIKIKKRIPAAAGLGGGSADAAGVLLALDRIYDTRLGREKLEDIAFGLGSDVPFFITGGTKRVRGTGEQTEDLTDFCRGYFVIAKLDEKPSTGEMYRRLDDYTGPNKVVADTDAAEKAAGENDLKKLCAAMGNSFMPLWEDSQVLQILKSKSPLGINLSGSGPSFFAVYDDLKAAKKCEKALRKAEIKAWTVIPVKKSVIIE